MSDAVARALRVCGSKSDSSQDLDNLLNDLNDIPPADPNYPTVDRFVACLVNATDLSEEIKGKLREWGEHVNLRFSDLLQDPEVSESLDAGQKRVYLLVQLRLSQQKTIQGQSKAAQYFVDVWVIPDWQAYLEDRDENCDRIHLSEAKNGYDLQAKTYGLSDIPAIVGECLNECEGYESEDEPIIEIFLPDDLMDTEVDQWCIKGMTVPLGCHYVMVVRSSERLAPRYRRYRRKWKKRWASLQGYQDRTIRSGFHQVNCEFCQPSGSDDCNSVTMLIGKLLANKDAIGLKFIPLCKERTISSVLETMRETGLPLAFGLRHRLLEDVSWDSLDQILECRWDELLESVKEHRISSLESGQSEHMGRHLSLLWENPNRLPPDVDYTEAQAS